MAELEKCILQINKISPTFSSHNNYGLDSRRLLRGWHLHWSDSLYPGGVEMLYGPSIHEDEYDA